MNKEFFEMGKNYHTWVNNFNKLYWIEIFYKKISNNSKIL
jgi:hypothetical protein